MWGLAGFLHPLWQWHDYIWVGIILWLLINQTIIFIVLADVIIQWITTICRPYLSNGTQWQYLLLTLKVSKFWPQRSFHELWGKREKKKTVLLHETEKSTWHLLVRMFCQPLRWGCECGARFSASHRFFFLSDIYSWIVVDGTDS